MIKHQVPEKVRRSVVLILITLFCALTGFAKNADDVVIMKNGDRLTGEIKGLESGELRIKPGYWLCQRNLIGRGNESTVKRLSSYIVSGKLYQRDEVAAANTNDMANFVIGEGDQAVRVHQSGSFEFFQSSGCETPGRFSKCGPELYSERTVSN